MIDKKKFFASIRTSLFSGKLTISQVKGMLTIINEWEARKLNNICWLAYMLATTFHETARTMQPIEEYGQGHGKTYSKLDYTTGHRYYGRGFVQLTWKINYEAMGKLLGVDLVHHPDLALKTDIATKILFEGMIRGSFTGRKLSDYFYTTRCDWVNARRIINGTDKAQMVAGYAVGFYKALKV